MKDIIYKLPHSVIYFTYKFFLNKKFKQNQLRRTKKTKTHENSLVGFDKHKCIFIHIPKAAGVSLAQNLFGNLGGGHIPIYKYYYTYSPKEFDEYFKFTIVRNPWDRIVSAYHFLKEGGFNNIDADWFKKNLETYEDFNDFVLNWVCEENIFKFVHFIPQYCFLGNKGKLLVNKVYKFEEINEMYNDLNNRFNLNLFDLHKNKTKNRMSNYRSYYNNNTKNIVANTYKKDIELFNYKF